MDNHIRQLLEAGGNANSTGPSGNALAVAASKGYKSTVQLLLKLGANVNAQEVWKKERNGTTILTRTALHSAIEERYEDIAHVLLDHGAAVNTKCMVDVTMYDLSSVFKPILINTPLQAAVRWQNTFLVRTLLDRGSDVTVAGAYLGDALFIACFLVDVHMARLLLEEGADPNAPQANLPNTLTMAIKKKHEPLQRLLVEYGAEVALVELDHIRTDCRYYDHMGEDEIEGYFAQIKARLAQVERRPKRSIAISDSVEERKNQRRN